MERARPNQTQDMPPSSGSDWVVASETGPLQVVLLCRPEGYHWIPTNEIARKTLAQARPFRISDIVSEFEEFVAALETASVQCRFLKPDPALPYQVYTRDSSQMTPWGVALTRLAMPQRRGEVSAIEAFYAAAGVPVWRDRPEGLIEGGDIHVVAPGLLVIGHSGGRTDETSAGAFAAAFAAQDWETVVVPFEDRYLHLDVIFSMVTPGLALLCEDAVPPELPRALARRGIRWITVSEENAMADMACNVLALGRDRVLSPRHSTAVNAALRAEGLTVIDPDLRLFAWGGGSAHCMAMPLHRAPD